MEEVWVIGVVPAIEPPIIKSEWLEEKKKIQYLECERVWARISVPFLGLGVLVYICACLFLLAVGGALMVVIIWYLWCPCGVLMIRCLSNGMEAHYYHVMLHHWLWVNGLLFVWWLPRRTKIDVTLVHCLLSFMDEDIIRTICYPPIPRSSIFGTITGIWRVFFFFLRLWAFGVPLPVLIAPWWHGMHCGHVSYSDWLKCFVFGETFQLSHAFQSFSSHFFLFSCT